MADKPVYSTATGRAPKDPPGKKDGYVKSAGPAKMRLETAGRGGKAVTVLFNLPFEEAEAVALMKQLQSTLGCGATFKEGRIELRGDVRARVEQEFAKRGQKLVKAGG